jgi:hypothetical protein
MDSVLPILDLWPANSARKRYRLHSDIERDALGRPMEEMPEKLSYSQTHYSRVEACWIGRR